MSEQPKPRRSPSGGERKRDAERTRGRILDAALVEFGEHGFAGARIQAIARRAGANQQLISYYFGGKEGLYRALLDRWRTISGELSRPDAPLEDVVAAFTYVGESQRHWSRLLIWQALSGEHAEGEADFRTAMVDDVRRRQAAGELAGDLDPPYVLLALFGAALAPTILSDFAADLTGVPAGSPEFLDRYRDQLKRLVRRLADPR
jgi:TetR/AcrR family transcriptional regulator